MVSPLRGRWSSAFCGQNGEALVGSSASGSFSTKGTLSVRSATPTEIGTHLVSLTAR